MTRPIGVASHGAESRPRATGGPRARRLQPRRLGADARISRRPAGGLRHRRRRLRRFGAGDQAGRGRASRGAVRCRAVLAAARRTSPATSASRTSSTGSTSGSRAATTRSNSGANNSGQAVGGSTTHFQMVSLRFRPDWFKARSRLGYGVDWPVDPERDVGVLCRDRAGADHLRPDPLSVGAAARALSLPRARDQRGGRDPGRAGPRRSASTGRRRRSAPSPRRREESPPCVYRGMCKIGCSTNAKQSMLVTYVPRAIAAGAEVRDLAMVGRVTTDAAGRPDGVAYHRGGARLHQQRAARRRRRLLDRDAAAAAELGDGGAPGRARQRPRSGRTVPDGAFQPRRLGRVRRGDPLVQGPAIDGVLRALELCRRRSRARTSTVAIRS